MRKFLLAALSAAAVGAASAVAHAADVAAPAAYDWSGPYVGMTAGYALGNVTQFESGGFESGPQDMEGFVAGGTLGYNHQMESFLVGIESDVSFSGISGDFGDQTDWGCGDEVDGCRTDVDWFATARLRLGLPMDSVLPYVTGGIAIGGLNSEIVGASFNSLDETEIGWTVGGGVEAAVSESLTVKAEVLYVDFGRTEDVGSPVGFEIETDFITARLGLNFQF